MKLSESWLRKWVNPNLTREALCDTLTMAGLEVEEIAEVAGHFTNVIVGEIISIEKHPEADRLNVCTVNVGKNELLNIVCGATNVKIGMKAPVAMINAELPNQIVISPTKIRGIASQGMLCSAAELGLTEENQGLLALPSDAPVGEDFRNYFALDDYTIDISITPNRGDCLSVRGVAREVAALTNTKLNVLPISAIDATHQAELPINLQHVEGCPRYVGRVIRHVKAALTTPIWLKERLRRSGLRSISPIVDVTNYVMLELGQPMHAFDLSTIKEGIYVRQSRQGENLRLLDGSDKTLDAETLVIADHEKPLAIAGVMGGLDSSVTLTTTDILLESAYFSPTTIARQRQFYNLNSDSAYRFERGVDPTKQREAMEYATQLILDIVGGEAGPLIEKISTEAHFPKANPIPLTSKKVEQVIGISISDQDIETIFKALNFSWQRKEQQWLVIPPSYRFDIALPEDLIEEIARLYGYDRIPTYSLKAELNTNKSAENASNLQTLRQAFSHYGYHEIISYSFVAKKLQALLDPDKTPQELLNPISADMAVMRTNLWPGLVNTLLYNKSRQQNRVRLFEIGTSFVTDDKANLLQKTKVGGLISGLTHKEQWGLPTKQMDFYDLKGDVENILQAICLKNNLIFKKDTHPALHPGQTAAIYHDQEKIGIMGALHPAVMQAIDLNDKIFIFELDLDLLQQNLKRSPYQEIAKFPEIRRDIAILVNQAIPAKDIQDTIKMIAGDWLKDIFIFDVYQGKGISADLKSIALALVLQHPTRTLIDDEVAELMERIIAALKQQLKAELRS